MNKLLNAEDYFDETFKALECSADQYRKIAFEDCEFVDCDFSESLFQSCKFTNCDFVGCNLSLVDFANSQLFSVSFKDCKLVGVDWTKADWPQYYRDFELKFIRCLLGDVSFYGLILNELLIDECQIHDADFREGHFTDSQMTNSAFDRSLFMHTTLQRVDFTGSSGCAIDVLTNDLKEATFSRYEAFHLLESLGIVLVD